MTDLTDSLTYLSECQDLVDLHDFMQDPELAVAMNLALNCIAKPGIPAANAREALIKLEALSFRFKMQAQTYMTIKTGRSGTDENKKKNVYFSASEQCHELAGAMKYLLKDVS